jgi:hypothetical protein
MDQTNETGWPSHWILVPDTRPICPVCGERLNVRSDGYVRVHGPLLNACPTSEVRFEHLQERELL